MSTATSTPSKESQEKDNDENKGSTGNSSFKSSSKRNRFKKRMNHENESESFIVKGDPRFKGYYYQCCGEPGRKPNQFTRTTNKIKDEFNKDHDAVHLLEYVFTGDEDDCKEPDYPGDNASRAKLLRWELAMHDYYDNMKL